MKEKDFQVKFGQWIKGRCVVKKSTVWELKIEKGKSFPFNKVQEHQIEALEQAKNSYLYHKINDLPIYRKSKTRFASKKPFDCFCFSKVDAFIVLWFYKPRQKKEMIWIDIDKFTKERDISARKSLTEQRAKEISNYIFKF